MQCTAFHGKKKLHHLHINIEFVLHLEIVLIKTQLNLGIVPYLREQWENCGQGVVSQHWFLNQNPWRMRNNQLQFLQIMIVPHVLQIKIKPKCQEILHYHWI